jgi:hypothetical protein
MSRMANERDFRKLAPATQAELRRLACSAAGDTLCQVGVKIKG